MDHSRLTYVSGYGLFHTLKNIKCALCSEASQQLVSKDEYFNELNRGGITVPTNTIIEVGRHMFCVFNKIISQKDLEDEFLKVGDQKSILISLFKLSILGDHSLFSKFSNRCLYGENLMRTSWLKLLFIFVNIVLNNHTSLLNDKTRFGNIHR